LNYLHFAENSQSLVLGSQKYQMWMIWKHVDCQKCFLMFDHFTWSSFEGYLSRSKSFNPQSNKWRNSSQIHTCMFSTDPLVYHNICRSKSWSSFLWVGLRVDRPSCGSVKTFTDASFFADILARLKT
jgi:hypothetical protein